MAVRFDDNLNKRINRTFKNFNAKVRYNKYKTRGKGILPNTMTAKAFKERYYDKSRKEVIRQLELYEKFGSRDALDLTDANRLSKWERNYFEANRDKTRKFYEDEISDLERIIGDKPEYHLRLHERLVNLKDRQKELDKDLSSLNDDQIKGLRATYAYAERSDLVKQQGFHTYLAQLQRTMEALGYSKAEINALISKFDVLSENEFTEMVRNEDIIDGIYYLIDSPKSRGKYELMTNAKDASAIIKELKSRANELIKKYKTS